MISVYGFIDFLVSVPYVTLEDRLRLTRQNEHVNHNLIFWRPCLVEFIPSRINGVILQT